MLHRLWIHTVVLAAVLLFLFAGVASATTHTVCVSGCDFTTIQAAENAAVAGDTVYVYNGTYTENIDVANASVSFVGEGRDVVTVQAAVTSDHIFNVTADWVNISGFTVTNATDSGRAGVHLYGAEYCNVSGNNASNNSYGFCTNLSANCSIFDNLAADNVVGIYLKSSQNCSAFNNIASPNCNFGIYLRASTNCSVYNNNLSDNGYGMYLRYYTNNSRIENNSCMREDYNGIIITDYVSNNTIIRNDCSGCAMGSGLNFWTSCNDNVIEENNCSNCGVYAGMCFYNFCSGNRILRNNCSGCNGVHFEHCSDNVLADNDASNGNQWGFRMFYSSDRNLLVNNSAEAFFEYAFTDSVQNKIRNPAGRTTTTIRVFGSSDVLIENNDSGVFSEDSVEIARAYPNGNFSLYRNGAETFDIVQRNITVLPLSQTVDVWNIVESDIVTFNTSCTSGNVWFNVTNATWGSSLINMHVNDILNDTEPASSGTARFLYDDGWSAKWFKFGPAGGGDIPPDPTTLANTTGNFWINHTWSAGSGNVTDSYNVSVNQTWHNGTTNAYWNNTGLSPHVWSNITVYAWNNSAGGNLSSGNISQDTQVPNNPITIINTSDWNGDTGENVYVDYDATDADSDTPTYSCSRTDLFTDFSTVTGTGNWTPAANGTYSVDFGVSDGWGSTSNYTMTIRVGVSGGITTETKIPMALFIALAILMFFSTGYIFYAKSHISRIFTTLIAAWMAFMLSQMIVSGNVVQMVSALDSADVWSHDTVAIQIPGLSYLLLFIGVILSIFLVKFVIDFGLEVLREAQREKM